MLRTDRQRLKQRQLFVYGGLLLVSALLQVMSRHLLGFAEWYAVHIYPYLVQGIGSISNLLPVALDELLIYFLVIFSILYIVTGICHIVKKQITWKRWLWTLLVRVCKVVVVWAFVFTLTCGLNYHRTPFSKLAQLPMGESSVEELEELCLWLTEEIEKIAPLIATDEEGRCALPDKMRTLTRQAMEDLGEQYPQLGGWYPKAKPVLTWPVLSYESLEGVFGPYTMEAHYNPNIPAHNQPAVLCHELSHLKGFMREDEANYIAYLACTGSENANLRYSGLLLAYTHSINALYYADYERFVRVRIQLCEQAEQDYAYHKTYWKQFEGPVSEISDKVNDTYLKVNAQSEGTKSYGRMVDLLLGEYRKR
ncbi:MAG: DUF3810 domain-containing protein [Lachnospiraceae bacterium]|jgi:hypothetical protein|nr:DUF3810 domain-containing protein [Lachnospiraceae bacterium]